MNTTVSTARRSKKPARKSHHGPTLRPYVWMLGSGVAFTVMGAFAHGLRDHCDWQVIAIARSSVALVIAAILVLLSGKRFVILKPGILWMRSFAGSVSLICTFYAFTRLPMADVFTLTNMVPIWVALISWPLLGRAPSRGVWLCILLGVAGVALIQQPQHLVEGNFAVPLACLSSLTSAIAMLGLNRLRHIDPRAIVVHFSAVATVVSVGALLVGGHTHPLAEIVYGPTILQLLGTGVAATVGQLLLTKAYAEGVPSKVAVVGLCQIVFSLGLDVLLFSHVVNGLTLLGMALVGGPTAWVMLRSTTPGEKNVTMPDASIHS